ncbi:MAG: hypothetical protein E7439_05765 [Ruminococcaceae bacterium]|nr:hypothetical protein [Oscillospiraceae bacterium]
MKKLLIALLILATLLCGCVQSGQELTLPSTEWTGIGGTSEPTNGLITEPSPEPTVEPTIEPTVEPTAEPTQDPTEDSTTTTTPPIPETDPYVGMTKAEFYTDYTPATSYMDAYYRSQHGFLSGSLEVPEQDATVSDYQPMEGNRYIRNTEAKYLDNGNTYVVVDANGKEVMRIYKAGGYITLEEVAAYMYAFGGKDGSIPANYTTKKSTKPQNSIWGEYLRLNHTYFSGDTSKYPYEPVLPNISGCGGSLQYYEMDIGTTGTVTPGNYEVAPYNNGSKIVRGAARLVYARQDLNHNGLYEENEIFVFYTHNHYNDFREYLNYYGGWGEIFGNVTGGGEYSSKYNCNPTPYVPTAYRDFF